MDIVLPEPFESALQSQKLAEVVDAPAETPEAHYARGLVRSTYLEDLLDGRLGGLRPRYGAKIWLLVAFEAWLSTVIRPLIGFRARFSTSRIDFNLASVD